MRFRILFFCCIAFASQSLAQAPVFTDSIGTAAELHRRKLERQHLRVLGTWSLLNIGSGLALQAGTQGWEKEFHRFNAAWNIVNASLSLSGFIALRKEIPAGNLAASLKRSQRSERIFLFNAGLDLAYLSTGLFLQEKGYASSDAALRSRYLGFGKGLLLQGGFLFVFDAIAFLRYRTHNAYFEQILESMYVGPQGLGLQRRF